MTNVRVVSAADFVFATPQGGADLPRAEALLAEIADGARGREDFHILIDVRGVHGMLSAVDLWTLSTRLAKYGQVFSRKTAVLCPDERFDHARFFSLCAEHEGYNIQAFDSYEEAMHWLLEDAVPTIRR